MDYTTRQNIAAAVEELAAPQTPQVRVEAADAIMERLGMRRPDLSFPPVPEVEFAQTADATVEMVDMRLILAQIAVQSGARDHVVLTRAQGEGPHDVILLRGGFVGLDALFALSRGTLAEDAVIATPSGLSLTRPLAIWSDAGLSLASGQTMTLARDKGSFIISLGRFDLSGGIVIGTSAQNAAEPAFRPFVLTAGQGSLTARNAAFAHLGFGDVPAFGGLAVVNSGLIGAQSVSFVVQSAFADVNSLALVGTSGAILAGNEIVDASGPAIIVAGARESIIAQNDLSQLTGPQAIRISANAFDVQVTGNRIAGRFNLGMLIDGDSDTVRVAGNYVVGSESTGIAVDGVRCLQVEDNLIAASGGAGISLKASDAVDLRHNAILFNTGAGLLLRDQSMAAQVQVTHNTLIGNREGMRGATPGAPFIAGNDLRGQMPRIFTGDLTSHMVPWLRAQAAAAPVAAKGPVSCLMGEAG